MSNRLASCGPSARSPTQSTATMVRKSFCKLSITVARTQPDVVQPATISVSTRRIRRKPD